jgi:hypothetical protein
LDTDTDPDGSSAAYLNQIAEQASKKGWILATDRHGHRVMAALISLRDHNRIG